MNEASRVPTKSRAAGGSSQRLSTFEALLAKSELIVPDRWQEIRADLDTADAKTLAQALVHAKLLTRWQAMQLLAGRSNFRIGKYVLTDEIGSGAAAKVYKARHVGLDRHVAIKVLQSRASDAPELSQRFLREVRALAALKHINIIAAYDADVVNDRFLLIMEYVEGRTLLDWATATGQLDIADACDAVRQAATGLQHAHVNGLVHRDIKPANLLASRDRESGRLVVKILDLGIARFHDAKIDGELTQKSDFMGTPDYIAPEQILAPSSADIRADIYSLGCTLFRLLTGEPPFNDPIVMVRLNRRLTDPARSARELREDIPAELDAIIDRMLARNPGDRPQTPQEVVDALEPFARRNEPAVNVPDDSSAVAKAETIAEFERDDGGDTKIENDDLASVLRSTDADSRLPREEPKAAWLRWPVALTVAGLATAGGFAFIGSPAEEKKARLQIEWPAEERSDGALTLDGRSIAISRDAVWTIAAEPGVRSLSLTRAGFEPVALRIPLGADETHRIQPEWRPLPQTTRRNELVDLKREWESLTAGGLDTEECAALRKKLLDFQQRWPGSGEAREAATLIASLPTPSASESGAAGVAGDSFQVAGPAVRNIVYNSTGDLVAALVPGKFQVRIWDSESGKLQASLPVQPAQAVAFRPGSREAAVVNGGTARAWNLESSRPRKLLPEGLFISAIGYSPDGKLLAASIGGDNKILIIHDANDGRQIHRFTLDNGGARCFAFSPDSRYIAAGGDSGVRIYDIGAGSVMSRITEGMAEVAHIGFSGNGKLIATAHSKSWNVQVRTLSGELKAVIEPDGRPIRGFATLTDGDEVMFYTNRFRETDDPANVYRWTPAAGKSLLASIAGPISALSLRPDGRRLAYVQPDGKLRFADLQSGTAR